MSMFGADLGPCPQCGTHIDPHDKFCRNCGGTNLRKPQKFCMACSTQMDDSLPECSECGGTDFTGSKPDELHNSTENIGDSDEEKIESPDNDISLDEKYFAPSKRAQIYAVVSIVVLLIGIVVFVNQNRGYADTENLLLSAEIEVQYRICATQNPAFATSLIWEQNYRNLEFREEDYDVFSDVKRVCKQLILDDASFATAVAEIKNQNKVEAARIEKERIAEAKLRAKYEPILKNWDDRAIKAGGGDLGNYLSAESKVSGLIKSGAQYSLTGVEREVQWAFCYATEYSNWFGGDPSGWWFCSIDFLGGSDYYSVEFNNGSWAAKADGGDRAGSMLNWTIPQGLIDWIARGR